MIDEDDFWSNWWNEIWQKKPKYSEKTYLRGTLSTTKSHTTDPVSTQGLIQQVESEAQSLGNEVTNKSGDWYDQTNQHGMEDLRESFKSNKKMKI
jgi:hypothetical protein